MNRDDQRTKLIEAAQEAASKCGGYLLRDEFVRLSGINYSQIYRAFPEGGFRELLSQAGIPEHPETKKKPIATEDLLAEMHRVFEILQRVPSRSLFDAHTQYSSGTTEKRFGGWSKSLFAYLSWAESNHPSAPWLAELRLRTQSSRDCPPDTVPSKTASIGGVSKLDDRITYGELLNFRGLQHAPINEQGVVYLFGMISHELGFLIEAVQTGFPDCHGKRRVKGNRWQPVRIEFEYQSRNFLLHGHDATQCDLIVCWEHNWPGCPIEVLSLQDRIKELHSSLD
jgi:hypothetical protein